MVWNDKKFEVVITVSGKKENTVQQYTDAILTLIESNHKVREANKVVRIERSEAEEVPVPGGPSMLTRKWFAEKVTIITDLIESEVSYIFERHHAQTLVDFIDLNAEEIIPSKGRKNYAITSEIKYAEVENDRHISSDERSKHMARGMAEGHLIVHGWAKHSDGRPKHADDCPRFLLCKQSAEELEKEFGFKAVTTYFPGDKTLDKLLTAEEKNAAEQPCAIEYLYDPNRYKPIKFSIFLSKSKHKELRNLDYRFVESYATRRERHKTWIECCFVKISEGKKPAEVTEDILGTLDYNIRDHLIVGLTTDYAKFLDYQDWPELKANPGQWLLFITPSLIEGRNRNMSTAMRAGTKDNDSVLELISEIHDHEFKDVIEHTKNEKVQTLFTFADPPATAIITYIFNSDSSGRSKLVATIKGDKFDESYMESHEEFFKEGKRFDPEIFTGAKTFIKLSHNGYTVVRSLFRNHGPEFPHLCVFTSPSTIDTRIYSAKISNYGKNFEGKISDEGFLEGRNGPSRHPHCLYQDAKDFPYFEEIHGRRDLARQHIKICRALVDGFNSKLTRSFEYKEPRD